MGGKSMPVLNSEIKHAISALKRCYIMDSGNENQSISLCLCFPFFKNTLLLQTCEERVDDFRRISL